jgi:hypothetical protein
VNNRPYVIDIGAFLFLKNKGDDKR